MWNNRTQYVTLLKSGIHIMFCVQYKMTILFLTHSDKCFIFDINFKDYYVYISTVKYQKRLTPIFFFIIFF